jgi:hypothetical protein
VTRVDIATTLNPAAFANLKTDMGLAWAGRVGREVVNEMKDRCPVDEGRLRSSLTYHATLTPSTVEVRIGSPIDYAVYVVQGTGIYGPRKAPIYPKTASVLKFPQPRTMGPLKQGQKRAAKTKRTPYVFARSVKGSPPNRFMIDALETVFGPGQVRVN